MKFSFVLKFFIFVLFDCKVVIYTSFMLALFHDKKCYNCIIFVHCVLWDFIVLGLVLS